jgi:hypothetical protein
LTYLLLTLFSQGALIIPSQFRFLFEIQQLKYGCDNATEILEHYHRVVLEQPNDKLARQKLLRVCRLLTPITPMRGCYSPFGTLRCQDQVMQIAVELADLELFCRALECLGGEISRSQIAQVAKAISQHGLDPILPS